MAHSDVSPDAASTRGPTATGDRPVSAFAEGTMVVALGSHWSVLVIFGVVTAALGVAALAWPGVTLLVVAALFAAYLLVNGVVLVIRAIAEPAESVGLRVLHGVVGALSIAVGLLCLRSPLQTLAVIALLIGVWWLVSGVLTIVTSLTGAAPSGRGWALLTGLISVIAGVLVLIQPALSLTALVLVLGVVLVVHGALAVWGGVAALRAARA